MGNRAVITASNSTKHGLGIYLHWDGGIESVLAFLDTAREIGYRSPVGDESYGMARLCGLICLFSGLRNDTGVGINDLSNLDCDNFDNGVFVVGHNWELVDRWGKGSKPLNAEAIHAARASKEYELMVESLVALLDKADEVTVT
jgi:hypothetical protein